MNGSAVSSRLVKGNPAIPTDLAEWLGAVRLTQFSLRAVEDIESPLGEFRAVPDAPGYGFRMLLTLLTYSYARGIYDSQELEERTRTHSDLAYLCAGERPDADTLRRFRRRHGRLVQTALRRLLAASVATEGYDADAEADRRLEHAAAADCLALDY